MFASHTQINLYPWFASVRSDLKAAEIDVDSNASVSAILSRMSAVRAGCGRDTAEQMPIRGTGGGQRYRRGFARPGAKHRGPCGRGVAGTGLGGTPSPVKVLSLPPARVRSPEESRGGLPCVGSCRLHPSGSCHLHRSRQNWSGHRFQRSLRKLRTCHRCSCQPTPAGQSLRRSSPGSKRRSRFHLRW